MKRILLILVTVVSLASCRQSPVYHPINGWPEEVNNRLQSFLDSTKLLNERKVAVFDGDGTTFGQVPYYLADEALYKYADEVLKGKDDSVSAARLAILDRMVKNGDNVSKPYVEDRVHFVSGLTTGEIESMGYDCYREAYSGKFFPEMKELIANLRDYGFEVWILTASPEILYQKFFADELGLSTINIIGAKCVIRNGRTTDEIIPPIPQDDGKALAIETFIKVSPLIVGGNSRGDMDMLNESAGLRIVVNPDDVTIRGPEDGEMKGLTVKGYWEKKGALIVRCNDVADPAVVYYTAGWKIRTNRPNPK